MIAIDAMGGDFAPEVAVLGALCAAKKGVAISLYGDQPILEAILEKHDPLWDLLSLSIVHCSQVIGMAEGPTSGVLKKKDSSLVKALRAVEESKAQAVVSAGNSGAALVAGIFILKRVDGLLRPALGGFLPMKEGALFCIDLGANTDCKPEYLEQFGLMGQIYTTMARKIEHPRIALLSNGQEPYKGSLVVKHAYHLLQQRRDIAFVGNLEPSEMFDNRADVLVCDGFSGNILLKSVRATAQAVSYWLKQECSQSLLSTFYLGQGSGVFAKLKQKMDYAQMGGALLLGLRHPLVVAHGCSSAHAIEQAIYFARSVVENSFLPQFNKRLRRALENEKWFSKKIRSLLHRNTMKGV